MNAEKFRKEFSNTPMGSALLKLNEAMEEQNMEPQELYVVGGFALMAQDDSIRPKDGITDIDYIGKPKSKEFLDLTDKIGAKTLGSGWINDDVTMTGSDLKDFELSTGKLHFSNTLDFGKLKIHVLDEEDVLRMKLIAVDTSLSAAQEGGDFSRVKDLPDVTALMERYHIKSEDIMDKYGDYIINEETPGIIQTYIDDGIEGVDLKTKEYHDAYNDELINTRATGEYKAGRPNILSYLNNLYDMLDRGDENIDKKSYMRNAFMSSFSKTDFSDDEFFDDDDNDKLSSVSDDSSNNKAPEKSHQKLSQSKIEHDENIKTDTVEKTSEQTPERPSRTTDRISDIKSDNRKQSTEKERTDLSL